MTPVAVSRECSDCLKTPGVFYAKSDTFKKLPTENMPDHGRPPVALGRLRRRRHNG